MPEKKLAALQDEIKLLKGEIKQSLASVRDYLLNMELPSSEISTILQALGSEGEQKVTMKGSFDMPRDKIPEEGFSETEEEVPATEAAGHAEEEDIPQDDIFSSEETVDEEAALGDDSLPLANTETETETSVGDDGALPYDDESELLPEDEYETSYPGDEEEACEAEDGEPLPAGGTDDDEGEPLAMDTYRADETGILSSVPKVNMMANLINWVSRAIRDIGYDQLPVFLEVYGVSGHLSPEMKDVILHLAELTNDKDEVASNAGIWSEQMLSLHGILTGGETPLHPVIPSWGAPGDIDGQIDDAEIIDADPPDEPPIKLKLVFPDANGESREYSIDLAPGALVDPAAGQGPQKQP